MTPRLRKFALTAHVTTSVGWLGAVAGFLALAVAGLTSRDDQTVRAAYIAMELIGWFVIVPLSLASLLTGLVMSMGTRWGLFRHYWVLAKLLITVLAVVILLVHMQPVSHVAGVARETTLSGENLRGLRVQLVADAGAALLALLAATVLGGYFVQTAYSSGPPDLVIAGLTVIDPIVAVSIGIIVLQETSGAPWYAILAFAVAGATRFRRTPTPVTQS